MNQYVFQSAIFLGVFFIVHCIFVIVRNLLFALRIARRIDPGFVLTAGAFGLMAVCGGLLHRSDERHVARLCQHPSGGWLLPVLYVLSPHSG